MDICWMDTFVSEHYWVKVADTISLWTVVHSVKHNAFMLSDLDEVLIANLMLVNSYALSVLPSMSDLHIAEP